MSLPTSILNKHKRWQYLHILELYSQGMSAVRISEKLQCSREFVTKALKDINSEVKSELPTMIINEVPLQFKASLLLLRGVVETCQTITKECHEERVRLQSLSLMRACLEDINKLMADSLRIASTIQKLERKQPPATTTEADQPEAQEALEEEGAGGEGSSEDTESVNTTKAEIASE